MKRQPYFCDDCRRRFYNKGWHAEVCGSGNYRLLNGANDEPSGALSREGAAEPAKGPVAAETRGGSFVASSFAPLSSTSAHEMAGGVSDLPDAAPPSAPPAVVPGQLSIEEVA